MLIAESARILAASVLVVGSLGLALGLVVGWQLRGYRELGRRGNDVNLVGRRPTRPS